MRQLTSVVIAFCFVVVALASVVDVVRGGGGPKSESDRQIDAILAKLRNKRWFELGKKEVKLSPEETLEQLKELERLGAAVPNGGYSVSDYIKATEISEENCNLEHMEIRRGFINAYKGKSGNLEAYFKHWARKQLALCAGPVEEAASKMSAERKKEIKKLGDLIYASEEKRLRWRYLTEADSECTAEAILQYLASKGHLVKPDPSAEYFKKAFTSVINPLCNMDQFQPTERTNLFRSFLSAPDLLTEVSQEVRDMAEFHRTCYAAVTAYFRTYDMRKCLLTEHEAMQFKCYYDDRGLKLAI